MRRFGTILSIIVCAASICRAEVASIPDWLPEDQRFEVEGTSNEIAQVEQTLALMRDALHPRLLAMMRTVDKDEPTTNAYPTMMGPVLQWIAHVSLPTATNEAAYFDSYKTPLLASALDCVLLTNRAARLSYLPPTVKLSLVFDDGKKDSVSRAIPGVDYPGISYEDEGSAPHRICLTLRAPKCDRRFKVRAQCDVEKNVAMQYKWFPLTAGVSCEYWKSVKPTPHAEIVGVCMSQRHLQKSAERKVAVFARMARGFWGPPSYIAISDFNDYFAKYHFRNRMIESVDYGTFRDIYHTDEQGRILGFTRMLPNVIRGLEYSNHGEQMVETYSDDHPKTTQKVQYRIGNGHLHYDVLPDILHYKNAPIEYRSERW